MNAAVAQLAVVQVGFLGTLACQLRHACHGLALLLALADFLQHHVGHVGVLVQVVVYLLLDEVAHILVHRDAVGAHGERSELDLRLAFEHRFLHVHRDGGHQAVADVSEFKVFSAVFLDGSGDVLLESTLVSAALRGMLTVDERVVLLAVLVGVRESNLYVLTFQVDDGIDALGGHLVVEQILQSVAAEDAPTVVHDGQTGVQIGVVAEHRLHDVVVETVVLEQRGVGFKEDVRSRLVLRGHRAVGLQHAALERHAAHLALAVAASLKTRAQGIHGFHADTVQSDRLLESLRVVLAARVEHADGLDELSLRYAAAIVAHADTQVVVDVHLDAAPGVHLELVDGVVDYLLQQHVDAVLGQLSVAQTADVHAWSGAHVLHVGEVPDVVVGIFNLLVLQCLVFFHVFSFSHHF